MRVNRHALVAILSAVWIAAAAGVAMADDMTDPEKNPHTALPVDMTSIDTRGFVSALGNAGPKNVMGGANYNCLNPNDKKCAVKEELLPVGAHNMKVRGANHYGPMVGLAAGMNSEFHTKQLIDNYMGGKLTLALATLGLTEPVLFSAATKGWELMELDVIARLQSEQVFFSQLDVMPDVKDQLGTIHVMCIKNRQEEGWNWMVAQTLCTNDTANKKFLATKKLEFNDLGPAAAGESFADIPELDKATTGKPGEAMPSSGVAPPSKTYLSDYVTGNLIRGEAGEMPGGAKDPGPSKKSGELLKIAFKELLGDIEFNISEKNAVKQGTIEMKYNRINPNQGFQTIYEKKVEESYSALQDTLFRYCQWLKGGGAAPDPASHAMKIFTNDEQPTTKPDYDFWTTNHALGFIKSTPPDRLTKLSMYPGFSFSAVVGEALFAHYENNTLAPDGKSSTEICKRLSTHLMWDDVINSPTNGGEIGRRYLNYAKRIAMGQTLYHYRSIAAQAQANAVFRKAPGFANLLVEELVIAATGVDDPTLAYEANLTDFIRELGVVLDETHAKSGKSIRQMKGAAQKSSSDSSTVSPSDAGT